MAIITMRVADDDLRLMQSYASTMGQTLSGFIKETVLDRIEDDMEIDEQRILAAWEKSKNKQGTPAEQVWKELGLK